MRSIQLPLLTSPKLHLSPEEAAAKRKHELIAGRPRRLEMESRVIKVGVPKDRVPRIDRIRTKLPATRPQFIRIALVGLRLSGAPDEYILEPVKEGIKREYWKIPFPPDILEFLACEAERADTTRQNIINYAIDKMLRHVS